MILKAKIVLKSRSRSKVKGQGQITWICGHLMSWQGLGLRKHDILEQKWTCQRSKVKGQRSRSWVKGQGQGHRPWKSFDARLGSMTPFFSTKKYNSWTKIHATVPCNPPLPLPLSPTNIPKSMQNYHFLFEKFISF